MSPLSVARFRNYFYFCGAIAKIADILKVFFALLLRKCGSFQKSEDKRATLISCVAMWLCTICAYTHTIQVWGIVAFIPIWVFPQPS